MAATSQQLRRLSDGFIPFAITHNEKQEVQLLKHNNYVRTPLFKNDFLLVGPNDNNLSCGVIYQCLQQLVNKNKTFLSRGDGSGTHLYELEQWKKASINPKRLEYYLLASGGAANSLRICRIKGCYLIVDETTFNTQHIAELSAVVRAPEANVYSLMYATDFFNAGGAEIINWLTVNVPKLSEQFGYKALQIAE